MAWLAQGLKSEGPGSRPALHVPHVSLVPGRWACESRVGAGCGGLKMRPSWGPGLSGPPTSGGRRTTLRLFAPRRV